MFEAALAATILTNCAITNIHDGDTLTAWCPGEGKVKVRLHCIDTPELAQKPWGIEARDHLRALAGRGPVRIVAIEQDRYGRTVGDVIRGRTVLNLKMVADGQAAVYRRYCDDPRYFQAETQARRRKIGIWSRRGLHQKPWEWRRRHRRERRSERNWWSFFRDLLK